MIRTSDSRWFSVGSSANPDSLRAGEEAAQEALCAPDPKLIIVFCSDNHDPGSALTGINGVSGGIPLIGATTSGEMANDWAGDNAVVVTAIGGPGFDVATCIATDIAGRQREAGVEIASCVETVAESSTAENRVLLALPDGLAPGHRELLRGAYSILGAGVPLVGGCAGDSMRMRRTRQLFNDTVYTNAVVAVGLASTAPLGIGIRHGWHQIGEPLVVTRTRERAIVSINDEPALDLYLSRLKAPPQAYHDPAAFVDFASVHPLGTNYLSGGPEMRFILGADFSERSLILTSETVYGTIVWFSSGDSSTILDSTEDACQTAVEALGGEQPIGLIAFDCVSRRQVLGDSGTHEEIRRITKRALGAPVSGFYTYGEIARVKGINGYHNQTLVVLAMS